MILDKDTIVEVTNRSFGSVGYKIPDMDIQRKFFAGETKELTMNELRHLKTIPGGFRLMDKYLIVHNEDAVNELMGDVEPEYYYTEAEIKELLANGTVAQLQDCLDFASDGVIELVKKIAVEDEVNNVQMRKVILAKTGFNVDNAIMVKNESENAAEAEAAAKPARRSAPITAPAAESGPTRRANPPKYNVVSKK